MKLKPSTTKLLAGMATAVAGVAASLNIGGAKSTSELCSTVFLALLLLGIATCIVGMGLIDAAEESKLARKIHKAPEHTVK